MLHCSIFVYLNVLSDKMSNMQVLGSHYYASKTETQREREGARQRGNIWPFEKPLVYKRNFNDQILTDERQRHRQEDDHACCGKLQERRNFFFFFIASSQGEKPLGQERLLLFMTSCDHVET